MIQSTLENIADRISNRNNFQFMNIYRYLPNLINLTQKNFIVQLDTEPTIYLQSTKPEHENIAASIEISIPNAFDRVYTNI